MSDMPDILATICRAKRREIERLRAMGAGLLERQAEAQEPPRDFRDALASCPGVGVIAEVKRASPSAGLIRADFDPARIAQAYERGGARCLSVLTDREFFRGEPTHLSLARNAAHLPVLRKDFILDRLQVVEARALGADAYLLIVAALGPDELRLLIDAGRTLGMMPLVEVHDRAELDSALEAGADTIGINNRNLHTFEVRLEVTERLAELVPDTVLLVSESGIRSPADVERLGQCGVKGILVGESLMRAHDIEAATRALVEAGRRTAAHP